MKQHDETRKGSFKSGGQRIDDHSFWVGGKKAGVPLPLDTKMKEETSAEGAGSELDYEDTTEKIRAQQVMGANKVKAHPMKPGYRN